MEVSNAFPVPIYVVPGHAQCEGTRDLVPPMPVAVLEVDGSPNLLKSSNLQLTDASMIARPKHLHVNRYIRKKVASSAYI